MAKATIEIRSLARSHTETALKVLAGIMTNEDCQATARVSAAQALLDRGWGKPSQPLDGDGEGGPILARIENVIVDNVKA